MDEMRDPRKWQGAGALSLGSASDVTAVPGRALAAVGRNHVKGDGGHGERSLLTIRQSMDMTHDRTIE